MDIKPVQGRTPTGIDNQKIDETGGAQRAPVPGAEQFSGLPSRPGRAGLLLRQGTDLSAGSSADRPIDWPRDKLITSSSVNKYSDAHTLIKLGDDIRDIEIQIAQLKNPPPGPSSGEHQMSEPERRQLIRLLEASHQAEARSATDLGRQCQKALVQVEQINATLEQKMRRLEQLHEERDAITSAHAAPSRMAAQSQELPLPSDEERQIDALSSQMASLERSRKKAANEVTVVRERDALRVLGAGTRINAMGGFSPELVDIVAQWLRGLLPQAHKRSGRTAPSSTKQQFDKAFTTAVQRMGHYAGDSKASARDALRAFMFLVSRCEVKALYTAVENLIARDLSRALISSDSGKSSVAARMLNEPYRGVGLMPAQIITKEIRATFDHTLNLMLDAQHRGFALINEQFLGREQISKAISECQTVLDMLKSNRHVLRSVIESMEDDFLKGLAIDDIEKMGQKVAPKLDAYYEARIEKNRAQRAALVQQLQSKPAQATTAPEAIPWTQSDIDKIDVQLRRLEGEIQNYKDLHQQKIEPYGSLSARYIDASERCADLESQIDAQRRALLGSRQERSEAIQMRKDLGLEASRLEQVLSQRWSEAAASPALTRAISRGAFERAMQWHVEQTPDQMRARMGKVLRTGTFLSRAGLLKVIGEIVAHELVKPSTALLAQTPEHLAQMAANRPDGRIDGLCSHGRTIGHGIRDSARGMEDVRTGTSQYSLDWTEGKGVRISHLHPWIPW